MIALPYEHTTRERHLAAYGGAETSPARAVLLTVAAVAFGLAARLYLDSFLGYTLPFMLFVPPVMFAAYYGGLRTGVATTALSVLVGWYFIVLPRNTLEKATPGDFVRVALFIGVGVGISFLAARIRRIQMETQSTQQRLALALEAGGLSVWDWDVINDQLIWGAGTAALNGIDEESAPRTKADFLQLVHPDDRDSVQQAIRASLERDEPYDIEFRTLWPDGSVHWVTRRGMVLRDNDGRPVRMLGVGADITSRKRTEAALRESEASLRGHNEHLQQFAYAAAHDLQEPLRNISIYSELLIRRLSGVLDAETTQFFSYVHGGARRMEQLISDLLRYTTAISGDVNVTLVNSGEAARQAIDALASAIAQCDAQITVGELPRVQAFQPHLVQLFQNLIGNALKYRDPGRQPKIIVSAAEEGGVWVFSVEDNGIGIRADYHDRIFGVFKRLHRPSEIEGTGIGLAIVKRIVEHYGGRIWVESEERRGSRFRFTFPAQQKAQAAQQSA